MAPFESPSVDNKEVQKNPNTEAQKVKEDNKITEQLNKEIGKKDGNNIADGMDLMAKIEFSDDELANSQYMNQFEGLQKSLATKTKDILSKDQAPEEKTKALKLAFEEFQTEIGKKRAPKEAQDAKRASEQAKNMEESAQKTGEKNKNFQDALLKNIGEIRMRESQEKGREAREFGNQEKESSGAEAMEKLSSTLAFGPPGNLEKENTKV